MKGAIDMLAANQPQGVAVNASHALLGAPGLGDGLSDELALRLEEQRKKITQSPLNYGAANSLGVM